MGRRPDPQRIEQYEELIPEYPAGVRPSQLARLLGVPRSTVLRAEIAEEMKRAAEMYE